MTVIIGLVESEKVYMGGDSCTSMGWHVEQLADKKVFRLGEFLIGTCGAHRLLNIMRCQFEPPVQKQDESNEHYIVASFVDSLRLRLKELGHSKVDNNKEGIESDEILVGYRNGLYRIGVDFGVVENSAGFTAIGSGSPFALGAMVALKDQAPEPRILQSLEIAAQFAYGVDHNFNIEVLS